MKTRFLLLSAALLSVLLVAAGCGKKQKAPATEQPAAEETVDMSQYMPALEMGTPAPDFEAPDVLGNPVKLSDYRGKYVV
ncbi:MAG: redoxin domain-containing protein, partial [Bacteroidales bacterium]|nr:redoxin domain-containing protein [Bacteroidales bacterium]